MASGFTLLELMLALLIMALVLTMVYSAFSAGSRACRFGSERAQIFHTARMAMQDILQAIENIDFGTNDGYRVLGEPGGGGGRSGSVPCDTLEFATTLAPRFVDERWYAGQSRVRYVVSHDVQDENGEVVPHVLEKWVTDLDDIDFQNPYITELSRNVAGLQFTYLSEDDESEEWDSDREDKLPETIRVTLYVEEPQAERIHPLRSAAMIPTMKATLEAALKQAAPGGEPTTGTGGTTVQPGRTLTQVTPGESASARGAHRPGGQRGPGAHADAGDDE